MSDASAADEEDPFEEQRQIYELLSQETRHLVLQYILGHPEHLPSLDEFAYLIPKNKAAIRDQLQVLGEKGIVKQYDYPPNEGQRDLPSQFYGLTEHGLEVLEQYNYLRGLPIARAIYENTRLSEKSKRHLTAPRPDLPATIDQALTIDSENKDSSWIEQHIRKYNNDTDSLDDQIAVAEVLYEAGIGPDHDGIKKTELAEQLDTDLEYQPRTILNNLVDIGFVEATSPPGPDVFAISERRDEIVNGRVTEEAKKNLEALIEHIDDELQPLDLEDRAAELEGSQVGTEVPSIAMADGAGRTIREILADEFKIDQEQVVNFLQSGDPIDRLNSAVEAVEDSEEVSKSEDYGRVVFVQQAYRYRLTEKAMKS